MDVCAPRAANNQRANAYPMTRRKGKMLVRVQISAQRGCE
jgi:hypothetical protein